MTDDGWTEYGSIYDRKATVGIIRALQETGQLVRVVREGNRNVLYVKPRTEAKP